MDFSGLSDGRSLLGAGWVAHGPSTPVNTRRQRGRSRLLISSATGPESVYPLGGFPVFGEGLTGSGPVLLITGS